MKFGFFMMPSHSHTVNPTLAFEQDLRLIEYAESLGFDEFWVGEHHWGMGSAIRRPVMDIVDQGIISHRTDRGSYMPGIELLPDGSFIACQFTASNFVASDARIEILRSADGLATWTNEGLIKGPGAAEEGWSHRGARIYYVPDGRLLLKPKSTEGMTMQQRNGR